MDFAIRTISLAISMRISSPQLQRRQGPDMGVGGGCGVQGGEEKAALQVERTGQPPPPAPLPKSPQIRRGIVRRQESRATLVVVKITGFQQIWA